jgi:hypothetical protein
MLAAMAYCYLHETVGAFFWLDQQRMYLRTKTVVLVQHVSRRNGWARGGGWLAGSWASNGDEPVSTAYVDKKVFSSYQLLFGFFN